MVIFENRRQARKVKGIQLLFICWAIGFFYWAWLMSETYGLSPGEGGVLKPATDRYLMALMLAAIGIVPLAGMIAYTRLYVVRIERRDNAVLVGTIGWLSPAWRVHGVADFNRWSRDEGRMQGRVSVHAPWISLYVAGSRWPYIVDLQAENINGSAIAALTRATGEPSRRARRKMKRASR